VGAVLVGLVAGLGYWLAAWWMDRRLSGLMLAAIVVLQLAVYLGAQYVEYRDLAARVAAEEEGAELVGFWEYFDAITRAWAFKERHGDGYGEPMGAWGYAFRALEMAGFALGGLIAPLVLRSRPYCRMCGVYMKRRTLGVLPAGLPPRKFRKGEEEARAAYEREAEQAMAASLETVQRLAGCATRGDMAAIEVEMAPHAEHQKMHEKLSSRLHVTANECRVCGNGALVVVAHHGQANQLRQVAVGEFPLQAAATSDVAAELSAR
jgi:hypothetical protein